MQLRCFLLILCLTGAAPTFAQENTLAENLRKFDAATFVAGSEQAKELPGSLGAFLKATRDRINIEDVETWRGITKKAEWERLLHGRLPPMHEQLFPTVPGGNFGGLRQNSPFQSDTRVHITNTLKGDGFRVENLLYELRHFFSAGADKPCLWVAANLYCPDPVPASAPGFVIIHSHHNPKTQGELQDMGMTWARLGCYVLVPDMLGHGERRDHPFNTEKDYAEPYKVSRQDYHFRYNLGMQLHHINEHLISWLAYDVMVGIDVLLTRPSIDRNRLIVLGSVAGGGDPAALVAAVDPRVAAVAPFNFGRAYVDNRVPPPQDPDLGYNYLGGGSWESTRNIAFSGKHGYLPWLLVSSIAPRGLIHAHEFAWNAERDPVWKRYQKIFSFYNDDPKLDELHGRGSVQGKAPESTHCNNIGPEHRKPLYPILKKWFDIPIPENEYTTRFKTEELHCWTDEWRAKLKPLKAHELMGKIIDVYDRANQSGTIGVHEAPVRASPKGRVVKKDANAIPGVTCTWIEWDTYHVRDGAKFATLRTYGLRLAPDDLKEAETTPTVVAIARRGKEGFLQHRSETIAELLRRKIQVLLVDLPGTGELRPDGNVGRTSALTSLASLAELTGIELHRYQEIALAEVLADWRVRSLGKKTGVPIALWSDSFAAANDAQTDLRTPYDVPKFPAIAEPMSPSWVYQQGSVKGIYIRGGIGSYRTLYDSPFVYLPYDAVPINGYHRDVPRTLRRLFHNYKLEAMVDAQNRVLSTQAMEKLLPNANKEIAGYAQPIPLQVSAAPSTPAQVAGWFEAVLRK